MLGWFKKKLSQKDDTTVGEPEDIDHQQTDHPPGEKSVQQEEASTEQRATTPPFSKKPIVQAKAEDKEQHQKDNGLLSRLQSGLSKTRETLIKRMDSLFLGKREIDQELLDEIEEILITSDIGVSTTQELLKDAREKVKRKELNDPLLLRKTLKDTIFSYLRKLDQNVELQTPVSGPFVIMVIGVNGVGKTTTIGKMGYKFVQSGQSVLLVAADTFRAAAIDQLKIWGNRINVDVIAQNPGADPSSVVYDAIDYSRSRDFDVIIIDTAGRLHTKVNLMEELKKIKRVIGKKLEGAPHEIMLVLDATTGQNSVSQARLFHEAVGVTGLALTKLDGTAKGGIIINISHELSIPVRFIGIGEKMEDLRDFDPKEFIEALFATENGIDTD